MTARPVPRDDAPGLAARRIAADVLDGVLRRRRPLDEQLSDQLLTALDERDRALVRRLAATVLRRLGTLRHLLGSCLDRGLPADAPRVETALLIGAAQILWLDVPNHAAVDLAVRLVQADRRALHYAGLVNAVLRRLARDGGRQLADADTATLDTPAWLLARWTTAYGVATAGAIALAHRQEPALDLTVKSEPDVWAARLTRFQAEWTPVSPPENAPTSDARARTADKSTQSEQGRLLSAKPASTLAERARCRVLPTGSLRMIAHGPIPQLPGYAEGAWWVQDAAAALPARLFGDVRNRTIADLCAAPGGKTAQLAQAGARVTAVDRSPARLARLSENLARLDLAADIVAADATEWQAGPFDAVLIDPPCASTGTIRRHPDVPWIKREADLAGLVALQRRLLDRAVMLTKAGGTIVYCTCSLEPEEGVEAIAALLAREPKVRRRPIRADEVSGLSEFITPAGDLRTLPCHWPDPDPRMAGLDGFYATRLDRL